MVQDESHPNFLSLYERPTVASRTSETKRALPNKASQYFDS